MALEGHARARAWDATLVVLRALMETKADPAKLEPKGDHGWQWKYACTAARIGVATASAFEGSADYTPPETKGGDGGEDGAGAADPSPY